RGSAAATRLAITDDHAAAADTSW
ncbi:MAG: hypothetical protein QOH14_2605, partial [Pseudonocardiales bacterium]|nr:hypothetical protein [Pseudonocardiales bacterium]